MTTRLMIVRHGETDWNIEERAQGRTDVPLNAQGIRQAQKVASRLKEMPIDAVYTSQLSRAYMTADMIAGEHSLKAVRCAEFNEMHMGILEGKTWSHIHEKYADHVTRRRADRDYDGHGGESHAAVEDRAMQKMREILRKHRGQTVLVVTHGGVKKGLLRGLAGIDVKLQNKGSLENTGITELVIEDDGSVKMVRFNCAEHLAS